MFRLVVRQPNYSVDWEKIWNKNPVQVEIGHLMI